jgi:hypothetical protein
MFFTITKKPHTDYDTLRTKALMRAFYIIKKYPLNTHEKKLDEYLQQYHKITLKDMCIKLVLSISHYENDEGNIILIFKDLKHDQMARLITYGTGAISGSNILKKALNS